MMGTVRQNATLKMPSWERWVRAATEMNFFREASEKGIPKYLKVKRAMEAIRKSLKEWNLWRPKQETNKEQE